MSGALVLLSLALVTSGCASSRGSSPERALLHDAIASAGGRSALAAANKLHWTGTAAVHAGGRTVEIGVDTEVVPSPLRAVSRTWLLSEGRETERTLEVDVRSGSSLRDGIVRPLPPQMLEHEQRQYELYGLMRLLPLERPPVRLRRLPDASDGLRGLGVSRPERPDVALWFGRDGALRRLQTRVHDPETGAERDQRIEFDGRIDDDGVRWPKHMRIYWDDALYFEMTLQSFDVAAG